jgi:hypothetical protein
MGSAGLQAFISSSAYLRRMSTSSFNNGRRFGDLRQLVGVIFSSAKLERRAGVSAPFGPLGGPHAEL